MGVKQTSFVIDLGGVMKKIFNLLKKSISNSLYYSLQIELSIMYVCCRSEQRRMSLQTVSPDLKGPKRRLSYDEGQHRGFFAGLMSLWRRRRSMTSPRHQRRTGVPSTIQEYQTGPQNERTLAQIISVGILIFYCSAVDYKQKLKPLPSLAQ